MLQPCQPNESVNGQPSPNEAPFFFFYEPVFLKLGIKLPFTAFERSVLRALNVTPSQLHPNSWAFVRAFELLCEDWDRVPSLGVFLWFFSVKKFSKVGWLSLRGRPRRKLLKSFLEISQGKSGPNILADQSGTPYFPLYWTSQPAVSVTIVRKDLEKWEDEFIAKLETLPHLSCSELIHGIGFFVKFLKDLKKQIPQNAEEGTSTPIVAVPEAEKYTAVDPLILSEGSQAVTTWSDEDRPVDEEILERPAKRVHLEEPEEPQDNRSLCGVGLVSRGIILGRPSRTLDAIQRLAGCSAILARAAEAEFSPMADRLVQKTIVDLQEELQRSNDNHSSAQAKWEVTRASLTTEVEDAKRSLLVDQEKISSLEFDLVNLQAEIAA
ncbi:hypothetical protein CR513_31532, partial [Mucuna pruriens]